MKKKTKTQAIVASPPAELSDKNYEQFIKGLDLIGLGLKSSHTQLNRGALAKAQGKGQKPYRIFEHNYVVTRVADKFFDAEGSFIISIAASEADEPALKIECVYQVHIHAEPGFERSYAERFADCELRLVLVPYARQFISNISSQMSIPPVIIPFTTGKD